jgi:Type I phosphodiesterase / nucleotide pyrophosphatase
MNSLIWRVVGLAAISLLVFAACYLTTESADSSHPQRNVIIFVADGLRHGSVNPNDSPTMAWIRDNGVNFENSYSLFPTFTTANASAIATGHYLGDTGDYSNVIYSGYPLFQSGNFDKAVGTNTPFLENDPILGDLDGHFNGNYLNQATLLSSARAQGMSTAVVGKLGPAAIQDVSELNPVNGKFVTPDTVIIDDWTGTPDGVPLSPQISSALKNAGLSTTTPARVQPSGNNAIPGTLNPNTVQQAYFADVTTKVILPLFQQARKPFLLVYWSRDPDGTQHNQGDSLNKLTPGINGPTSKAGLRNADDNLKQVLDYVRSDKELDANTDILITSDHGFATISKHDIDVLGHATTSYSTTFTYRDSVGRQEVNDHFLPVGFLAIDLAHALELSLFDPDSRIDGPDGEKTYEPVDPSSLQQSRTVLQHPATGNGLIGGSGRISKKTDAKVIVAANGGSDLIYLPIHSAEMLRKIVAFLTEQDYVGGIFVDDSYGAVPGALPLSKIRLVGSSQLPLPAIVVTYRTFSKDAANPQMSAVQIADTGLQQGQGMHGSLGRDNTFNFMAAIGPDFKRRFADLCPASNADITPTFSRILGLNLLSHGQLKGRVLEEVLVGGPPSVPFRNQVEMSTRAGTGRRTILIYEEAGEQAYFDRACFEELPGEKTEDPCH